MTTLSLVLGTLVALVLFVFWFAWLMFCFGCCLGVSFKAAVFLFDWNRRCCDDAAAAFARALLPMVVAMLSRFLRRKRVKDDIEPVCDMEAGVRDSLMLWIFACF